MNKQQLLEKRNAEVDALSETDVREYCNIMRTANNLILDATVAFMNSINDWHTEMMQSMVDFINKSPEYVYDEELSGYYCYWCGNNKDYGHSNYCLRQQLLSEIAELEK